MNLRKQRRATAAKMLRWVRGEFWMPIAEWAKRHLKEQS